MSCLTRYFRLIKNPHRMPMGLWGWKIIPIPTPYPYPWGSPWGSPYPRQPWKPHQALCRREHSTVCVRYEELMWSHCSRQYEHWSRMILLRTQLSKAHLSPSKSSRRRTTITVLIKKVKVAHDRLPSVGFRSWSRFLAVSLQMTWVINPVVGCHYFPPDLQLPWQPVRVLLPVLLLGEQRSAAGRVPTPVAMPRTDDFC